MAGRYTKVPRQQAFLKAFAECGTITAAAKAIGISRAGAGKWLERDPEFAERFEIARQEFADRLEEVALKRAIEGTEEYLLNPKTGIVRDQRGKPIMQKRYSDRLMIEALKAKRRSEYGEQVQVNGTIALKKVIPSPAEEKAQLKEAMQILGGLPLPIDEPDEIEAPQLPEPQSHPPLDVIDGTAREVEE
jgi:hypothetical protein